MSGSYKKLDVLHVRNRLNKQPVNKWSARDWLVLTIATANFIDRHDYPIQFATWEKNTDDGVKTRCLFGWIYFLVFDGRREIIDSDSTGLKCSDHFLRFQSRALDAISNDQIFHRLYVAPAPSLVDRAELAIKHLDKLEV